MLNNIKYSISIYTSYQVIFLLFHNFSMEGGELFQRISDRNDGPFTERGMFE